MEENVQLNRKEKCLFISTFLGKLIHGTYHENDGNCLVLSQAYHFDQLQEKFITAAQKSTFHIQVKYIECISHELVEDDVTGLLNLHIVLKTRSSKQWTYYVLRVTSTSIQFISQFYLTYQIPRGAAHLTVGPRVIWVYKNNLIVYNAKKKSQKVLADKWKEGSKLLWSGIIGGDLLTFSRVKNMQDRCSSSLTSFPTVHHFEAVHLRNEIKEVSNCHSHIIPDAYADIVTVMSVMDDDSVIFCTSESQLISCKDGKVLNICSLPFKNSMRIEFAVIGSGRDLIIVHSESYTVCCICSGTFEIMKTWQRVSKVVVSDFCHCGSDQILLLDADTCQANDIFTGFILTDLQRFNFNDGAKSEMDDDIVGSQSNLKSAVRALETRMQVSVAVVKESRLKLADKVRMIHQSHKALVNMAMGKDETKDQPNSLICLFDGSKENPSITDRTNVQKFSKNDQASSFPSFSSPWQCLVEDQWVVGMNVRNNTKRSLHNITLSLVVRDNECPIIQTRSYIFSTPTNRKHCLFEEPLIKRMKPTPEDTTPTKNILAPNDAAFLCTATNLPSFLKPFTACNLVVNWKGGDEVPQGLRSTCVGSVTLAASDVATEKLHMNFQDFSGSLTIQEELSLNTVQLESTVDITSRYSNISQIGFVIQSSLKFLPITNSTGFIHVAAGILRLCRIYITILSAKNLRAKVYTRNEQTLYLLIHSLHSILPDDVTITLFQSQEQKIQAGKEALDKLERELMTQLRLLTEQVPLQERHKTETPLHESEIEDNNEKGTKSIDDWRGEFANEQNSSNRQSTFNVEGATVKRIAHENLSNMVATDTAFMKLAKISSI